MNIKKTKLLALLLLGGTLLITGCANTSSTAQLQSGVYTSDDNSSDDQNTPHIFFDENGEVIDHPVAKAVQDGAHQKKPVPPPKQNTSDDD